MELDEIKYILRSKLEASQATFSSEDLEATIRQRTNSLTNRIKRNLWMELAACLVCILISVWAWVIYPLIYVHLFCIATWLFGIAFCTALLALYKKITRHEKIQGTMRESLRQTIIIVTKFTGLYASVSIILLPVIYVFGLITGYMDVAQKGLQQQFHWSTGFWIYTMVFFAWSVIIYFFNRWYIRKLYGNYLEQLQQQLKDIENG